MDAVMIARDLFNFVYDNPEKRNLMLSIMTVVERYENGRGVRFYHGFENPEKISLSDFEKSIADGFYLYFKYAHFDDEIFLFNKIRIGVFVFFNYSFANFCKEGAVNTK